MSWVWSQWEECMSKYEEGIKELRLEAITDRPQITMCISILLLKARILMSFDIKL